MLREERIKEAKNNFPKYLADGLIKKQKNETAKEMFSKNADISLRVADKLLLDDLEAYLWVIVSSYYSMFYIANAYLLELGYKIGDKIVHKVTNDALIVLVLEKLTKELIGDYEEIKEEALEIASMKADELIGNYEQELHKRAIFQYEMSKSIKKSKAVTSLKRAKEFNLEIKKLMSS